MTTKKEQREINDVHEQRVARSQEEMDKRFHLTDPLTDPSNGDPPPAISPEGDRLGTVPVTRNAVADMEQAKQEGLKAAEHDEPTKAERASKSRVAERTAHADRMSQPAGYVPPAEKSSAARSTRASDDKKGKGTHT